MNRHARKHYNIVTLVAHYLVEACFTLNTEQYYYVIIKQHSMYHCIESRCSVDLIGLESYFVISLQIHLSSSTSSYRYSGIDIPPHTRLIVSDRFLPAICSEIFFFSFGNF